MPSPPITATRMGAVGSGVTVVAEGWVVTGRRLVVVGALAAVVPQVERGLDRLVAARVLGLVAGRTPVGVHVVHGKTPRRMWIWSDVVRVDRSTSRRVAEPAHPVVGRTTVESGARIADRAWRGPVRIRR